MRSKFTVIWILLFFLAQACASLNEAVHPAASQVPALPTATATAQTDASAPIVETTLPQVVETAQAVEITPVVSTAVAASTSEPLPLPLATETPQTSGNILPAGGITLQDRGKTFTMKTGEYFLFNRGTDIYDWTVSIDNENVLRMRIGVMVIQVAQGIYDALAPGTATLTATGNPYCLQSQPPCGMPSILFNITIIVEWLGHCHFFTARWCTVK